MSLDSAKQEVLDHLNVKEGLRQIGSGAEIGMKSGAIAGAALGQIFPPASPIISLGGAIYGAGIGAGIAFLNGLFTTDPAVTKRKAQELVREMTTANTMLNNMFATWPPAARDSFVGTKPYYMLVGLARSPDKYQDTYGYIDDPIIREQLRENIRVATISAAYPTGIVLGDDDIRAQVKDRIEGRASVIQSGILTPLATTPPIDLRPLVAPIVIVGGVAGAGAIAWAWERYRAKKKAREASR